MKWKLTFFRVLALIALAGSVVSYLEGRRANPFLCGFDGGCTDVASSAFGHIGPFSLSIVGILFFAAFFLCTFLPGCQSLLGPVALLAGVGGFALVAIQAFVLKTFCRICLGIDAAAMLLAIVELALPGRPSLGDERRWPWFAALVLALTAPVAVNFMVPEPPLPQEVIARRKEGAVNLFLITDFECGHCRALHEWIDDVLADQSDVALEMEILPLPKHVDGRKAARYYYCARKHGKGKEIARRLFESEDLSEASLTKAVNDVGLAKEMDQCLTREDLDAEVDAATAWLNRPSFRGLPILWVEDQVLVGQISEQSLRAAVDRARQRKRQ